MSIPPWVLLSVPTITASVGLLVAIFTLREQRNKLEAELKFQREKVETEMASQREKLNADHAVGISVESAIAHLLSLSDVPYRSFPIIRHHLGGFASNELRQLLVRAGAVRFMAADGTELWALISRVEHDFKYSRWKHSESPQNKVPKDQLFPGAFNDLLEY